MQEFPLYRSIQQEAQIEKSRSGALNLLRGGTYAISPMQSHQDLSTVRFIDLIAGWHMTLVQLLRFVFRSIR